MSSSLIDFVLIIIYFHNFILPTIIKIIKISSFVLINPKFLFIVKIPICNNK